MAGFEPQPPKQWAIPSAPPTQPYFPQTTRPSNWPVVIGVICIVFGGLGLLTYGLAAFGNLIMPPLANLSEKEPRFSAMFKGMAEWSEWLIALSLGAAALSVSLLVGGIALLSRKRWAITLLVCWAIARTLFVPVHTVINYNAQKVQMAAMTKMIQEDMAKQRQPGQPAFPVAAFDTFFQFGVVIALIFGVLWGWALPVIILIWFARRKIRQETASWA